MDQGVKIAAACSVLLGGMLVAMLFRHPSPQPDSAEPDAGNRLVLRNRVEPPQPGVALNSRAPTRAEGVERAPTLAAGAGRAPTVLTPGDSGQSPPELARDYPGDLVSLSAPSRAAAERQGRELRPSQAAARTHKIVDGDTLSALAERYLGSGERAGEIYQANRDVLPGPEVLPIGVELRLPPRGHPGGTPPNYMPRPPLVPVRESVGGRR